MTPRERALRLSAGVALRRAPERFQFVCPSAWGDSYAAPLAALADGTIVVGATRGLMLLSEDGLVRAHPDPAALGDSSDVVRSARGVFSLRATQEVLKPGKSEGGSVAHKWRFFRAGGVDQVQLSCIADLAHLGELDQELSAERSRNLREGL